MTSSAPQEQLSELFGSYKAEWLKERIFDLFTKPHYFPALTTARPCVLLGGRGTGKTTVLKCLSYEGQFALQNSDATRIPEWAYYGMYYRVNTNRVSAFEGPELADRDWQRLFAHYMNLLLCSAALRFLEWYSIQVPDSEQLPSSACERIALSLNIAPCPSVTALWTALDTDRLRFEAYINNVADGTPPPLSLQGAPLDALFEAMLELPHFKGKEFFFLLDEYENFRDYQQQVVNTLIKHSGQLYTFKLSVRELGWRRRDTVHGTEQLSSPADYVKIDIAEQLDDEAFGTFAKSVCDSRVALLTGVGTMAGDISTLLPGLSDEQEAVLLGVEEQVKATREAVALASPTDDPQAGSLTPLQLYFISYRVRDTGKTLTDVVAELATVSGRDRYENYKHALLFSIRRRKRGIRKYYVGWDTFILLAARNIRYLIELVDKCLTIHLADGKTLNQPVGFDVQTYAAQAVGKKNLAELEGLSVEGPKLMKLLLGLGRVFQVMAADMEGHAPEVNHFRLGVGQGERSLLFEGDSTSSEVGTLVTSAVMQLALLRTPGNKLTANSETQEFDYMVHPIFSPFFVFSHRRKRKTVITEEQIVGLVRNPPEAIKDILGRTKRVDDEDTLPDQLALFEAYYAGGA